MYKESKWAKEIISGQDKNGLWGYFHTLSEPKKTPLTTEQALRRLLNLGFTIHDEPIQKTVAYMHDCLAGKKKMPDRDEVTHDWGIFTQLMLSTWIRKFTKEDAYANEIAKTWGEIISFAFQSGKYIQSDYLTAYTQTFNQKARGGRLVDFVSFYQVSLIPDYLDTKIEQAVFDYIFSYQHGIYYIYQNPLNVLPENFMSKAASKYLAAIELLSMFPHNKEKLARVINWLNENKLQDGKWDMGSNVKDAIYFPLSDSWNKKDTRISDCTFRIECLLNKLSR